MAIRFLEVLVEFVAKTDSIKAASEKVKASVASIGTTAQVSAAKAEGAFSKLATKLGNLGSRTKLGQAMGAIGATPGGWGASTALTAMSAMSVIAAGVTAAIAGIVVGLTKAVQKIFEASREMQSIAVHARQAGMAISALESFKLATVFGGTSMTAMAAGMAEWQDRMATIKTGFGNAALALRILGVNARTSNGHLKDMGTLLEEVSTALQAFTPEDRRLIATAIFGENSPMGKMALGTDVRAARQAASEAGIIQGPQTIREGEKIAQGFETIWEQVKVLFQGTISLFSDLLGLITGTVSWLLKISIKFVTMAKMVLNWLKGKGFLGNADAEDMNGTKNLPTAITKMFSGGGLGMNGSGGAGFIGFAEYAKSVMTAAMGRGGGIQEEQLLAMRTTNGLITELIRITPKGTGY